MNCGFKIFVPAVLLAAGKVWADGTNGVFARPAWLTDCSVGIKEGYDNNVFQSGVSPVPAYNPAAVPAGSVVATKDRYSWITTVSPKIGVNFAPALGVATNLPVLSVAYAPDVVTYHDQTSESYDAQRVLAAVKGGNDAVSVNADNAFTYVNGSGMGPYYPGKYYSAFATTADRERRRQSQDRGNIAIQFGQEKWFFRPTASLLDYNLMTLQTNVSGYQNYCDRYDVNGGADLGCKVAPKLAFTLGYRYGHQYQQQYSFSTNSASSDYQRVLAGVEGSPCSWLNVKIVSGPDFRSYQGDSASHTTPVNGLNPVKYYGEALVTATLTPANTLTFKYKDWQWVSGSGNVPYYDQSYELAWHNRLTDSLGLDLGGKFSDWDYTGGNLPTCRRRDLLYTATGGLTYAVNAHVSITLAGVLNWARNDIGNIPNPSGRDFNQQLITLGTVWKF